MPARDRRGSGQEASDQVLLGDSPILFSRPLWEFWGLLRARPVLGSRLSHHLSRLRASSRSLPRLDPHIVELLLLVAEPLLLLLLTCRFRSLRPVGEAGPAAARAEATRTTAVAILILRISMTFNTSPVRAATSAETTPAVAAPPAANRLAA